MFYTRLKGWFHQPKEFSKILSSSPATYTTTDWHLLTGPPGVHNFIEFHPLGSWHATCMFVQCLTDWHLPTGPPGVHNFIEFHPLGSWHATCMRAQLHRVPPAGELARARAGRVPGAPLRAPPRLRLYRLPLPLYRPHRPPPGAPAAPPLRGVAITLGYSRFLLRGGPSRVRVVNTLARTVGTLGAVAISVCDSYPVRCWPPPDPLLTPS
eukprot:618867-Prorocentrum_minimum.AAC.1